MRTIIVRVCRALVVLLMSTVASCVAFSPTKTMSVEECGRAETCTIRGFLEMSNDGHAYIGKVFLESGGCVNASLPEAESRRRSGRPMEVVTITGDVFSYIYEDSYIEYFIDNRKIGYGACGDYFLFVK